MNQTKSFWTLRIVELVTATLFMVSKYYLSVESDRGWYASIAAFVLQFVYFIWLSLPVAASSQLGMLLLNVFGWYKWNHDVAGLLSIDYVAIVFTVLLVLYVSYQQHKKQGVLRLEQMFAVMAGVLGFIFLAYNMALGWWMIIVNLLLFNYIFVTKKSYIFVLTQTISIGFAVMALVG